MKSWGGKCPKLMIIVRIGWVTNTISVVDITIYFSFMLRVCRVPAHSNPVRTQTDVGFHSTCEYCGRFFDSFDHGSFSKSVDIYILFFIPLLFRFIFEVNTHQVLPTESLIPTNLQFSF